MVSISPPIIRIAAAGTLSVAAITACVSPASAAQTTTIRVAAAAHVATTGPNTNIKGTPPKWNPAKLTVPPVKPGTCSSTNYSFTIDNKTAKAQTILYKSGSSPKQTFGTLKADTEYTTCGSAPKGTSIQFYIKGAKSILTVTVS